MVLGLVVELRWKVAAIINCLKVYKKPEITWNPFSHSIPDYTSIQNPSRAAHTKCALVIDSFLTYEEETHYRFGDEYSKG
jgi:hypothetical protein